MRGAASIGGRSSFRPPANTAKRGLDPLDVVENFPSFDELETAPTLEPINDEWSISDPFEPVDPRDCSKYPASPYCENDLLAIGPPVGFEVDIRSNNCTTCVYIYPVVGFMRLTPTVICRRDPNCKEDRDSPPPDPRRNFDRPPRLNENVQPNAFKSPECAFRESVINRAMNRINDGADEDLKRLTTSFYTAPNGSVSETEFRNLSIETVNEVLRLGNFNLSEEQIASGCFDNFYRTYSTSGAFLPTGYIAPNAVTHKSGDTITNRIAIVKGESRTVRRNTITGDIEWVSSWFPLGLLSKSAADFITWTPAQCCGMPKRPAIKPPPPAPPPFGRDDDRQKKKKGGDDMCCGSCNDAKENTDKLLKEIKEIKKALGTGKLEKALNAAVGIGDDSVTGLLNKVAKRIGIESYPIEVPEALLQGQGDKVIKLQSNAEFLYWIVTQMDGLIGQFPIDIEVKDIDPLKAGDQKKTITLPNIAEAIAELYGLTIKSSVNQEVELNMLLRLAAETIATKNAAVVTQDYARANANFLGYKANYKPRELQYNFDFSGANLDPKAKQPIVLENLLRTVTGYVQGWQLEDKETVVGFLQKLMFSAGIIKAVFFRGKGNQKELNRELNSMSNDDKGQEAKFEAFIKEINDPNSKYNKDTLDKPEIKEEKPPEKPKGAK